MDNTKTILLAEDELVLAELFSEALKDAGYRVVHVAIVRDLVVASQNQKFDLMILDLKLKENNSERIIRQIKNNSGEQNFKTPILVVSGELDQDIFANIREHIAGVLLKPFSTDTLVNKAMAIVPSLDFVD